MGRILLTNDSKLYFFFTSPNIFCVTDWETRSLLIFWPSMGAFPFPHTTQISRPVQQSLNPNPNHVTDLCILKNSLMMCMTELHGSSCSGCPGLVLNLDPLQKGLQPPHSPTKELLPKTPNPNLNRTLLTLTQPNLNLKPEHNLSFRKKIIYFYIAVCWHFMY